MDELLLFFRRQPGWTTEGFGEHYLTEHAPMATAWVRTIGRYVVNLPDVPGAPAPAAVGPVAAVAGLLVDPDAVTEVWVESLAAFQDRRRNFADLGQANAMRDDHNAFIDVMHGYVVVREVDDDRLGRVPPDDPVRLVLATWAVGADTDGTGGAGADLAGVITWDRTVAGPHRFVVRRAVEAFTPGAPALVRVEELTVPSMAALRDRVDLDAPLSAPGRGAVVTRHVLGERVFRA